MQVLLYKMKYDPDWDNASMSYDPLHIFAYNERQWGNHVDYV